MAHHRDDAPPPGELVIAQAVETYGVDAVFGKGKVISAREARNWRIAQNVELYYSALEYATRTKPENWDNFCEQYQFAASVLDWAEKQYKEMTNGR